MSCFGFLFDILAMFDKMFGPMSRIDLCRFKIFIFSDFIIFKLFSILPRPIGSCKPVKAYLAYLDTNRTCVLLGNLCFFK